MKDEKEKRKFIIKYSILYGVGCFFIATIGSFLFLYILSDWEFTRAFIIKMILGWFLMSIFLGILFGIDLKDYIKCWDENIEEDDVPYKDIW